MKTLQFKSNIKCGGCIASVTPHFEKVEGISHWEVDLKDPDRLLTVKGEDQLSEKSLKKAAENAGYEIVRVDS